MTQENVTLGSPMHSSGLSGERSGVPSQRGGGVWEPERACPVGGGVPLSGWEPRTDP